MPKALLQVNWRILAQPTYWVIPTVMIAVLLVLEKFSFLLFHMIAEGLTIVVAGIMAAIAWQTYSLTHNRFFTFLAYGFFWTALIDLAHVIVYKGMNILPILSANAATQFWIGARGLEALVLFVAMLGLHKLPKAHVSFGSIALVGCAIFGSVLTGAFPDAYVEPEGLTTFKVVSEYVIIGILATALVLLGHRRDELPETVIAPLGAAIVITMLSELAFTFYVGVYDLSNTVGHVCKLLAFWFIFIAIVRTTLAEPFKKLQIETDRQHQTERQLRDSDERLQTIMANTKDAIIMVDHFGQVVFWNKTATKMFQYSEMEVMGQEIHGLLASPDDLPHVREQFKRFAYAGEGPVIGRSVNLTGYRKDGTSLPLELAISAVHDDGHWGAIAIARDVTQRQEAERQLRQLQKSEAIESLAAGIAHDFKNMLLPIICLTGMCLKSADLKSRDHVRLEKILEAANRASDLAKRILEFSHEAPPAVQKTNLSDLVTDTAELLKDTLLKTICVNIKVEPNLYANVDPTEIRTVIMNLGSNASDAMAGQTGELNISLVRRGPTFAETMAVPVLSTYSEYGVLVIRDEGEGMNKATLQRIFDPYFTTKDVGKGTGLGLPVVHSIITKHGGTIIADSVPDEGTTITVYLPLLAEQ